MSRPRKRSRCVDGFKCTFKDNRARLTLAGFVVSAILMPAGFVGVVDARFFASRLASRKNLTASIDPDPHPRNNTVVNRVNPINPHSYGEVHPIVRYR